MMNSQEATMGDGQPKKDRGASKFPFSRRQKQYWGAWAAAFAFGLLTPWFLESAGMLEPGDVFDLSSSKISNNAAIFGSIIYSISLIIIGVLYHKGMDEQEERAYLIANTASWYFLMLAIPVWWLFDKANIAPQIDGIAIATASLFVNLLVWVWKKFF
jgi:hypothetical protein